MKIWDLKIPQYFSNILSWVQQPAYNIESIKDFIFHMVSMLSKEDQEKLVLELNNLDKEKRKRKSLR